MKKNIWFASEDNLKDVDEEMVKNWKSFLDQLLNDPIDGLSKWKKSPRGSLCCIILLNQISRYVYRGNDEIINKANNIALDILDNILKNTEWVYSKYLDLDLIFLLLPYVYICLLYTSPSPRD